MMSFGYSSELRFDYGANKKKPLVFWEEQAIVKSHHTDKKFKYVGKEQKFPLRNKRQATVSDEEMPAPRNQAPASRRSENRITRNNTRPTTKTASRANDREVNAKPASGPPRGRKPKPKTADTVVLTQKQFDNILETIGNLTIEVEDAQTALEKKTSTDHVEENIPDINQSQEPKQPEVESRDHRPEAKELPLESSRYNSRPPQVEPSTQSRPPKVPVTVEPQVVPGLTSDRNPEKPEEGIRKSVIGVPTAHLTKAERKRLQWERERAESAKQEEWSPWGRPGAGAPVRDNQGNVVSDYNKRQRVQFVDEAKHIPDKPAIKTEQNQPPTKVPSKSVSPTRSALNATAPVTIPSKEPPPPAAIRSSFTIGAAAPDEDRFSSAKDRQRKQWLEELEKQREEQRQRKQSERDKLKQEELHDTWAERFAPAAKPAPLPEQSTSTAVTHSTENLAPQRHTVSSVEDSHLARVNSTPVQTSDPADNAQTQSSPRSNIRGQNVLIDDVTRRQLEEKRRKHEEHQAYIRQQIEEKERLKKQEKDRRLREEQAEEEKMRGEREALQNQLQAEKERQRAKENEERRRLEALKQAMEEAQEKADREKHEKRMRKLQQAGHDTTQWHATFEAKMTPRYPETSMATTMEPSYEPRLFALSQGVPRVEPTSIPGLDLISHEDHLTSRSQERVITPTKLRQTPVSDPRFSPRRDNASQTVLEYQDMTRESTEIEYRGPIQEKKKKVRVKSASKGDNFESSTRSRSAPAENQAVEVPRKRKLKLSERPKWGTRQPEKKGPVKQSEKDPFFYQRQRQREHQRAQRQEKMHRMAEEHAPKASETTTVASRARSRSGDRKDDELRARSKSPPVQARNLTPADPIPQVSHERQSRVDVHSRQAASRGYSPHNKPPSRNASPGHHLRSVSPPIPAIKHRRPSEHNYDPNNYNAYAHDKHSRAEQHSHRDKYLDRGAIEAPVNNGQFVPFIRSSNVLDPAHAESPLPMSREPSSMDRARKAYVQEHDPAKFGFVMDNFRDDIKKDVGPQQPVKPQRESADPIMNPALVTEHPSQRQSRILQQLSDLRKGLMQKQRELEIGLPGMEQALLAE